MSIPKIVVVGGGAGGLELVTRLGNALGKKKRAEVHLVDCNPTHLWKPLLHEVATGSMDSGIDEISYRSHAFFHGFTFHLGKMHSLDRQARTISLAPMHDARGDEISPERTLAYDYLVLALGSQTNDFGTPGAAEYCAFLDSRKQADLFHKNLINTYLRLSSQASEGKPVVLEIGIVGAGATGVELAAELHNTTALLGAYGLKLGPQNLKVTIIEAGPRVLPVLPTRISNAVVEELGKLNIAIKTNTKVTKVTDKGFETGDGEFITADMRVWAAGVKAPDFLQGIDGLETTRNNQVEVLPSLQSTKDDRIFAIGDCASCPQPDGSKVPPRAQSAHQMASHVYVNLRHLLANKPVKSYIYKDHGSLVSLSRYSTVGNLMGNLTGKSMMIEGRIARFVYISLYRLHQIALHGYIKTALIMFSARINKIIRPRLKLH
ncbi:NAD(P)/FAD-dependent oxidoreductase [Hahella sp. KA22]|uniref:NAD(P)/FAD-dependent oxidoreductase n=1 Tax=Hahella sp. KA22 TaxID=1628392 RepID=UPI000FDD06AA|nr:NAD(P)/FAD-dependent oxidoreductase [Hahella sp. KA22]AZZ95023.1 NAD(P)/FAD-dependent oxidoreductase [Hahella sp. KA22]QAY52668.1 NAD(P)/FAD-dependent oxidoreductase [Hahella sp. KA22]